MNISVFGLGYVGCVTAACLASEGHKVIGVDINPIKVKDFNSGISPVSEKGLEEKISNLVKRKNLFATTDSKYAVLNSDITFICVGTPSDFNGSLNIKYLERVSSEIGEALKEKNKEHYIVNRSTSLPGTLYQLGKNIEKNSGKKECEGFSLASNPEFLREGSAIEDFYNPSYTIIGSNNSDINGLLKELFAFLDSPIYFTYVEEAEFVKYINNVFHALKITFANEIGRISKSFDIDSRRVMDFVAADKKLNISPKYLKPGFAFGGSCLPKDLRALSHYCRHHDIDVPLIDSILKSNEIHSNYAFNIVNRLGRSNIGFIGFAFKPDTDDLRESPAVGLAERLIGKGNNLLIYDQKVFKEKLIGANREFILKHLPHFFDLLTSDLEKLLNFAQILIIVQPFDQLIKYKDLLKGKKIIDFVGLDEIREMRGDYIGLCW